MKWSFASVGVIVLGIIGVMVIVLFQQLTTTNENDYYLLKEITEASMIESIDIKYYRETGNLKIVKEKFVENFTRRYAESTLFIGNKYTLTFYDIIELPPKVTITIDTGIEKYRIYKDESDYNVINNLTGILEYNGKPASKTNTGTINNNDIYAKKEYTKIYYTFEGGKINIPKELNQSNIKLQDVTIENTESTNKTEDILVARLYEPIDWQEAKGIKNNYNISPGNNNCKISKEKENYSITCNNTSNQLTKVTAKFKYLEYEYK